MSLDAARLSAQLTKLGCGQRVLVRDARLFCSSA
jgi:hypothetical protein